MQTGDEKYVLSVCLQHLRNDPEIQDVASKVVRCQNVSVKNAPPIRLQHSGTIEISFCFLTVFFSVSALLQSLAL